MGLDYNERERERASSGSVVRWHKRWVVDFSKSENDVQEGCLLTNMLVPPFLRTDRQPAFHRISVWFS